MNVRQLCEEVFEDVVKIRRKIHEYPETGFDCPITIDLICNELDKLDIEYKRFDSHGVIAEIKSNQNSDKTIMLRADMDALDIKEETGLDFASKIDGKMHACGHDLHTAMLLGTARILSLNKDAFKGNIRLLFQTAEEVSDGAKFLIDNDALKNVSMGFGMHVDPLTQTGKLSSCIGPDWAAVDRFVIKIYGKGGHGALPHKTCDATIAASSIALNLQTIVSRRCNPLHPLVVTIGKFNSGTAYNIISEYAELEGTCRCFDDDVYVLIPQAINEIVNNIANAYNCKAEIEIQRSSKPLINDEKVFNIMKNSALKVLDNENDFFICEKAMLGEDFAEYANLIPCIFTHLGAQAGYPLHNCHINFDEKALIYGMAVQVQFVLDALSSLE